MKNAYTIMATLALLTAAVGAQAQQKPTNTTRLEGNQMLAMPNVARGSHATPRAGGSPPNDDCTSVTFEALPTGGSLTFTGDLTGATIDGDYVPGSPIETAALSYTPTLNSVFHGFTLTDCADVTLSYCGITPKFDDFWIVIDVACPIGGPSIIIATYDTTTCADGNGTVRFTGLVAGSYYVPVLQDVSLGTDGPYSINVSAVAAASPATNDDCVNAIVLTPSSFCNPYTSGSTCATESLPANMCEGFLGDAGDDTWFSFVATQSDMTVAVIGHDAFDTVIEIFEGDCSGLSPIACADLTFDGELEQEELLGLTVGSTYYVRVFDWYATTSGSGNFDICVVEGTGVNIGIEETSSLDFSVFPNPGNGDLIIQCGSDAGITTIELIDLRGRTVHHEVADLRTGLQHELRLAQKLAAGPYTLRLTTADGASGQRILIQ